MSDWMNHYSAMRYAVEAIRNGKKIPLNSSIGVWKCWRDGETVVVLLGKLETPLNDIDLEKTFPEGNELWGETVDDLERRCYDLADSLNWEIDESLSKGKFHGYLGSALTSTFSVKEFDSDVL